ncbi:MAG: hypothetical protein ACEY3M_15135 [Wolbachia sp.]
MIGISQIQFPGKDSYRLKTASYSSSHNNPNKVRYGFMVVGFVCQQRIVMT